jgi:AraC-like DNA-binding protein
VRRYSLTEVMLNEFRAEAAHAMRIRIANGAGLWLDPRRRPTLYLVIEGDLPVTLADGSIRKLSAGDCALNFYGERQLLGDPAAPMEMIVPAWNPLEIADEVASMEVAAEGNHDPGGGALVLTFVLVVPNLGGRAFANRAAPELVIYSERGKRRRLPAGMDARRLLAMLEGPGSNALAIHLGGWLLTLVERDIALKIVWGEDVRRVRTATSSQISAILREVQAWPAKPWTVGSMARLVGLSRSTFVSAFTAATGQAPMTFLARERMERAARLMGSEVLSIQQVAQLVGYDVYNSFARAFKRHWGVGPAAFRAARSAPEDAADQDPEA